MDTNELLSRLQALEQRNAEQDRNNALQAFINEYGSSFSNEPNLGNVFFTELQNRLGAGAIKEINAEATQQLVDGLLDDIDTIRKYLKHSARAAEDMLDDVEERTQNLEKSDTKENNPVDTDVMPAAEEMTPEADDMMAGPAPADFMPEPAAPVPNMSGEAPVEPAVTPAPEAPVEAPAAAAPAEVPPVTAPAAPVPPEAGPAPVVSDERMKNIKAGRAVVSKFLKKKEPSGTKLDASIISACGGN